MSSSWVRRGTPVTDERGNGLPPHGLHAVVIACFCDLHPLSRLANVLDLPCVEVRLTPIGNDLLKTPTALR